MDDLLETIRGFKPIINGNSKILILGTIPGNKTLENFKLTGNEDYYINFSHNHFYSTIAEIFGLDMSLLFEKSNRGYQYRKKALLDNYISLFDIYSSCKRAIGVSSDNKIKNPVPSDIKSLLIKYSNIKYVYTNGLGTYKKFMKINKDIQSDFPHIIFKGLTSTSNANNGHFDINEWENALNLIK